MKNSEVLLLILVVILCFILYRMNEKCRHLQQDLDYCRDHPIENAADYLLD